jgi:hypothetical protein
MQSPRSLAGAIALSLAWAACGKSSTTATPEAGTAAEASAAGSDSGPLEADAVGADGPEADTGTLPDAAAPDALVDVAAAPAELVIVRPPFLFLDLHCPKPLPVQVRNDGPGPAGPLVVGLVPTSSMSPPPFAIGRDTCSGAILPAGAACTVEVKLEVSRPQLFPVALVVTAGGATRAADTLPIVVAFSESNVTLAPRSGFSSEFNVAMVGTSSAPSYFLLTADVPAKVRSLDLTGTNPGDFVIDGENCIDATLRQCEIKVHFQPTATGGRDATLRVTLTPEVCAPIVLNLHGTGVP